MPGRSAPGRGRQLQARAEVGQRPVGAVVERVGPIRVDGRILAPPVESDLPVADNREINAVALQLNLELATDCTEAKVVAATGGCPGELVSVPVVAAAEEVVTEPVTHDRVGDPDEALLDATDGRPVERVQRDLAEAGFDRQRAVFAAPTEPGQREAGRRNGKPEREYGKADEAPHRRRSIRVSGVRSMNGL